MIKYETAHPQLGLAVKTALHYLEPNGGTLRLVLTGSTSEFLFYVTEKHIRVYGRGKTPDEAASNLVAHVKKLLKIQRGHLDRFLYDLDYAQDSDHDAEL